MMQPGDNAAWQEAVREFAGLLKDRFGTALREVKLFGSRAR